MSRLSVIVPVYNSEKYLPECLESIENQTVFTDIQLILVDDGSSDGSAEICDSFAEKHKNVIVVHMPNGGVSSARNAGLDKAEGEYIGFVDSDDTIASDYYENLLAAAENNGCDMAFGGITFNRSEGLRECKAFCPAGKIIDRENISEEFARKMLTDGGQNAVWSKIMRRDIIESKNIRFPAGIKIAEDKLFVLEFLKYCGSIVCAGKCGYFYRDVQTSAMHSASKMPLLLAVNEAEVSAFVALGLDEEVVRAEKAVFLFTELADYLQREYCGGRKLAAAAAKEHFKNEELMAAIGHGLPFVKENSGTVYRLLANAFEKKNVFLTLAVLFVQKKINDRGERK